MSSIASSNSSTGQPPNPPPRTHSQQIRPNQPPPPPPIPTTQPVPPARDSSINMCKNTMNQVPSSIPPLASPLDQVSFSTQFGPMFQPLDRLPAPERFENRPKTYPSRKFLQKKASGHHQSRNHQSQSHVDLQQQHLQQQVLPAQLTDVP